MPVLVLVLSSALASPGLRRPPGTAGAAWRTCKYPLPAPGARPGFSPRLGAVGAGREAWTSPRPPCGILERSGCWTPPPQGSGVLGAALPSEPPLSLAVGSARPDGLTGLPRPPRPTGMRPPSCLSVRPSPPLSPISGLSIALTPHPSFPYRVPAASTELRGQKATWWVSVGPPLPPWEHPAPVREGEPHPLGCECGEGSEGSEGPILASKEGVCCANGLSLPLNTPLHQGIQGEPGPPGQQGNPGPQVCGGKGGPAGCSPRG